MLSEAPKADKNIKDTEQTRGMITSLWLIAENIGGWSGSFLGGVAYENLGFEGGSLVIISLQVIIVVGIPYAWYRTKYNQNRRLKEMFSSTGLDPNKNIFTSKRNVPVIIIDAVEENTPLIRKI